MDERMMTLISGLNSTGPGHDGILMFVFKKTAEVLSSVLIHMCNKSLSGGKFPPNLSVASVSCRKLRQFRKYRPKAFLPSFSKIFDKSCKNIITRVHKFP